jgi:hypothetical protein
MDFTLILLLIAVCLFLGMILLHEAGRRIGMKRLARDQKISGTGPIEGAVFALMGLLVAFTFSGAASRFDARRALIVEEANDIGTAYLRLDLLRPEDQPALRELFRTYLDVRIETYRRVPDMEGVKKALARSVELQREIWSRAEEACMIQGNPAATSLLLSALNAMIDITTTRTMAIQMHPPLIIFGLLFGLSLVSALLAGYDTANGKGRSWAHVIGFAAAIAITFYVIIDVEYPRLGLIRVDSFDEVLVTLRSSMD